MRTPSFLKPLSFEQAIAEHDWRVASGYKGWPVSKDLRKAIYKRDNGACYYCGSRAQLTLDHKVPQVIGGSSTSSNLVTCCRSCNCSKCSDDMQNFIQRRFGDATA